MRKSTRVLLAFRPIWHSWDILRRSTRSRLRDHTHARFSSPGLWGMRGNHAVLRPGPLARRLRGGWIPRAGPPDPRRRAPRRGPPADGGDPVRRRFRGGPAGYRRPDDRLPFRGPRDSDLLSLVLFRSLQPPLAGRLSEAEERAADRGPFVWDPDRRGGLGRDDPRGPGGPRRMVAHPPAAPGAGRGRPGVADHPLDRVAARGDQDRDRRLGHDRRGALLPFLSADARRTSRGDADVHGGARGLRTAARPRRDPRDLRR